MWQCGSGAEICVGNSSVVKGLNLDPIGQIHLRPFCGNTVTADLVCLNISLHDSDVPTVTPNHVVKVTCAVVPGLDDQLILTADFTDRLYGCNVIVSQAQVNDVADSPATVDNSEDVDNDVTVVVEQNDADCDNVGEGCSNVTDGGSTATADCSLSQSSEVAKEPRDDPSLTGCWKLADKARAGFVVKDTKILGQDVYQPVVPESRRAHVLKKGSVLLVGT